MKIDYKKLKKKESVFELINTYGKELMAGLFLILIVAFFGVGGFIVSNYTSTSVFEGILDFTIGVFLILGIYGFVTIVAMKLYELFTYVRTFFRYAYLPLTIQEAKALEVDKDPVAYVKALTKMMCYKKEFTDNVVAFYNPDTDKKLSHLFYQLFFCKNGKDDPVIFDVFANWDTREGLIDAFTTIKKVYGSSEKYSLIKSLTGFYDMLREIPEIKIIDAVVFKEYCRYIKNASYGQDVKAVLETEDYFYLICDADWLRVSKYRNMECMSDFLISTSFAFASPIMTAS